MNETVVTVVGNVASEVRHHVTARGVQLASFRVASTPRWFDRNQGWTDGATSFYSVTCWRQLAAHVASSVHIGEPVVLTGRLRVRPWEREDGRRGVTVEVVANAVGHDLSRGTSAFVRAPREGSADASDDRRAAHALADELAAEWPDESADGGSGEDEGSGEDRGTGDGDASPEYAGPDAGEPATEREPTHGEAATRDSAAAGATAAA